MGRQFRVFTQRLVFAQQDPLLDLIVVGLGRLVVVSLGNVAGLFGVVDGNVACMLEPDELLVCGRVAVELAVHVRWVKGGLSGLLSERQGVWSVQHGAVEGRVVTEHERG